MALASSTRRGIFSVISRSGMESPLIYPSAGLVHVGSGSDGVILLGTSPSRLDIIDIINSIITAYVANKDRIPWIDPGNLGQYPIAGPIFF